MKTAEDAAREKKFLNIVKAAHAQFFEEGGEVTPESILTHVMTTDQNLWQAMQPQLAEHGGLLMIKGLIKKISYIIDGDEEQLDLFPNMPRVITFKRRKINLMKAGTGELDWYGEWWNLRLQGLAKRTEEDLAISGEVERLKRILKKYDPTGTVESALRIRHERLLAAQKKRARVTTERNRKR